MRQTRNLTITYIVVVHYNNTSNILYSTLEHCYKSITK